ncbi:MAG: tetratricopeptide repeat protein [Planctomycetota bacterium]|jgi:tetratricopeptide (TPR) repeat protein
MAKTDPENTLVLVTSSTYLGKKAGNGFVIGDGTLVVTAYHIVFEESEQGQHTMGGLVRVLSPYLGQGREAYIIAADRDLDLAVLKVNWQGHPALRHADDGSIKAAETMKIIGMPDVIDGMTSEAEVGLDKSYDVQYENLSVDFVAERKGVPRFISLSGTGKLKRGWSGTPMLFEGTSCVAGCFVRLHRQAGQQQTTSQGPAISQVIERMNDAGFSQLLISGNSVTAKPKDAAEAYLHYLRIYQYSASDNYELASQEAQKLIKIRPTSALAYSLAAYNTDKQGENEKALKYYQEALKLEPDWVSQKILYAQYLSEREPDKALEMLEELFKSDKSKAMSALLIFNILSERGDFQRCVPLFKEALQVNPNNAYLHLNLGACNIQLGRVEEAIISIEKAVELIPERGPFRGQLAYLLTQTGNFERAEIHYRKLLEIEPDNPVVHFWLAQFLAEHRPSEKEEALKVARIALGLPAKRGLPKQQLEQFIKRLEESGSVSK